MFVDVRGGSSNESTAALWKEVDGIMYTVSEIQAAMAQAIAAERARHNWPVLKQDGDVWVAYDPETGVYSQAETEDAACVTIREAVRLYYEMKGALTERIRCATLARSIADECREGPLVRGIYNLTEQSEACEDIARAIELGAGLKG